VGDQQVAVGAVAAGVIEGDEVPGVNVDEQGQLALPRLLLAVGAFRHANVRVGIKGKVVLRFQLTEAGFLLFGHSLIPCSISCSTVKPCDRIDREVVTMGQSRKRLSQGLQRSAETPGNLATPTTTGNATPALGQGEG